jgi:hypothetical protein
MKPLRLWPGIVLGILLVIVRLALPPLLPDGAMIGFFGGLILSLLIVIWWLFFSRAPWLMRIGGLLVMVLAVFVTRPILHESIATGMMGFMFYIYVIPGLAAALLVWALAARKLSLIPRLGLLVVLAGIATSSWALLRTEGMTGDAGSDLHWRWTATPEERLLEQAKNEQILTSPTPAAESTPQPSPTAESAADATKNPVDVPVAQPTPDAAVADARVSGDWPGFRGARRDGVARGVKIKTDWTASPPVELWRRAVGPGWSSFAVRGEFLYTQEQRGEDEIVACYKLATGEPVWRHRDPARFWESNAGAGPRGTPTLSGSRVYSLGATGILNVLDSGNGTVKWSRNAAEDTETKVPGWGFAGSPLVLGDLVIVATAGKLVAYDLSTGKPRWVGPDGGGGYSSPQLAKIGRVNQVVLLAGSGAMGVSPTDGTKLWEHKFPGDGIVQPGMTTDGDLLIGTGSGIAGENGMRRFSVSLGSDGWTTTTRWTSIGLKPYYNDFVVHRGMAFGFDGSILACVDLSDGKRKWKGGRYGHGQLVLIPDQDLLLVLSEEGEVALVKATPDQFAEVGKFRALEGKTWNHPVVVGDLLLTRNGEQMAAFRLPSP